MTNDGDRAVSPSNPHAALAAPGALQGLYDSQNTYAPFVQDGLLVHDGQLATHTCFSRRARAMTNDGDRAVSPSNPHAALAAPGALQGLYDSQNTYAPLVQDGPLVHDGQKW